MNMLSKNSKKGVALFIALALMFLLSICAVVTLLTAYNYANISENQINRSRAMNISESGINYAYWKIRVKQDDAGGPITYPCILTLPISLPAGWSVRVDIAEDPFTGTKTISSKVTY